MENNYAEEKFFEHYIRKYYNYAIEARDLYQEKLMNYRNLDDFHQNSLQDANNIVLKYVELTINELSNLSMDNISKKYFFKNYYDKEKYYIFKEDLDNIKSIYEDLLAYEREVKEAINEFNSNKYNSSLKIYPKNLASIPTSLALNAAASIVSGAARTLSNKKQIDSIKNDIENKKNYVLTQIKNSDNLTSSLFNSVFNMLNAFFDCIEDYLGYKVNRNITRDAIDILNSSDDQRSIQICIDRFKKDVIARHKQVNSVYKSDTDFLSKYGIVIIIICIIIIFIFLILCYEG